MTLTQVKEKELLGIYLTEQEFITDCKQAIKDEYNYSDILSESIFIKAYSRVSSHIVEMISELEDYCKNIAIVMEVK